MSREERIEIVIGRSEILIFSLIAILICSILVFLVCFDVGIAHGRSMFPVLREGDFCLFSKVFDRENIPVGSIILYYSYDTNTSVCHRIISAASDKEGRFYVTKGDYNSEPDASPVRPSQILGLLVFSQSSQLFYLELFLGTIFACVIVYIGIKKLKRIFQEIFDQPEIPNLTIED